MTVTNIDRIRHLKQAFWTGPLAGSFAEQRERQELIASSFADIRGVPVSYYNVDQDAPRSDDEETQ